MQVSRSRHLRRGCRVGHCMRACVNQQAVPGPYTWASQGARHDDGAGRAWRLSRVHAHGEHSCIGAAAVLCCPTAASPHACARWTRHDAACALRGQPQPGRDVVLEAAAVHAAASWAVTATAAWHRVTEHTACCSSTRLMPARAGCARQRLCMQSNRVWAEGCMCVCLRGR